MKPGFALSLSFSGISLLQRAAGGWRTVGEVSLESTDLSGDLGVLRNKAEALSPGGLHSKIIIPNDQIRFLDVETGHFTGEARLAMVRRALDGATPYPVDDLAFDISVDGDITYVAAVARETLAEAEAFASEHGFNPVSFVSIPGESSYLGEPFFGTSAHAVSLLDDDGIEPDGIAVVVIGPAEDPVSALVETPTELPASSPAHMPASSPAHMPAAKESGAVAGFSSRRRKVPPSDPAPKVNTANSPLGGAHRDTAPPPAAKPAPGAFKSSHPDAISDVGDAPADPGLSPLELTTSEQADDPAAELRPSEPIIVTAPTLDIPEFSDPEPSPDAASRISGFLSRRKKADRKKPKSGPIASPISGPISGPVSSPVPAQPLRPEIIPISRPAQMAADNALQDEAARMTVFGARETDQVGGKPRFLGLFLAIALLVFLAVVAIWATIFLDDGLAGLFRSSPAKAELAAVPGTPGIGVKARETAQLPPPSQLPPPRDISATDGASVAVPTDSEGNPDGLTAGPSTLLAALPETGTEAPDLAASEQPAQPALPDLSDTDSAVLDALGTPQTDQENPPVSALSGDVAAAPATSVALMQQAPDVPTSPSIIGLDDLYIASIDRTDLSQDAVALPNTRALTTDLPLGSVSSPTAAGTAFDLDRRGLVTASLGGTLNPDGVMVYLGRPPVVPPKPPTRFLTEPETDTQRDRLAGKRPHRRPDDLAERFERSNLGGLTRTELSSLRPKARPKNHQQEVEPDAPPTAQAVVSSRIPKTRPRNFDKIVSAAIRPKTQEKPASASASTAQIATIAPRTVTPKIPSSASVARQATMNNAINLRRVNLIGVYGTPSNRRALVRLPSGRYKKVKVGDAVDGGRVVAIGDTELRYQKSGRNMTLKMPRG